MRASFDACCECADQSLTAKFPPEAMILGGGVDAPVHRRVVLLVPLEIISETITTLTAMKDEVATIAVTFENDHSPHDRVARFPLPRVVHTAYQRTDLLLSAA